MTDTNSRLLLDSAAAADLAPRPGRAIWQWDDQVEVQLPMLEKAEPRELLAARYGPVNGEEHVFDARVSAEARDAAA